MPPQSVSEYLARQQNAEPFNPQDWLCLVEARKASMMKQIEQLGQMQLGRVSIWRSRADISGFVGENYVSVTYENHTLCNLSTRGVFFFDPDTYGPDLRNPELTKLLVYGFARNGAWLVARIRFYLADGRVQNKTIQFAATYPKDLRDRYGVQPRNMLEQMSRVIEHHYECRRDLAEKAAAMWHCAQLEDALLETLAGPQPSEQ